VRIATAVEVSRATVARIVGRCGRAGLHVLDLPATSRRYERGAPGALLRPDRERTTVRTA
jgi:hypothetical protein